MQTLFAAYGLPVQVVSDNGSQFTLEEFKDFMKGNHIKHILSTPYHISTNGLAERFVQTFKKAMWASENSGKPLSYRLVNFLLSYQSTPHGTTNHTLSKETIRLETMVWLEMAQSGCPVRWLNGGAHSPVGIRIAVVTTHTSAERVGERQLSWCECFSREWRGGTHRWTKLTSKELSMESQTASETPTTTNDTTDSKPAENTDAGEPNRTEASHAISS